LRLVEKAQIALQHLAEKQARIALKQQAPRAFFVESLPKTSYSNIGAFGQAFLRKIFIPNFAILSSGIGIPFSAAASPVYHNLKSRKNISMRAA
jgi:hypothetical protein